MTKGQVKFLCSLIPSSGLRKKARKSMTFRFVLTEEERNVLRRQKELYNAVMNSITEKSVCIDCGANIGQETVPWAERGAEVYAFEPHPQCFKLLKEKTSMFAKVHLFEQGVWHENGKMNLYFRNGSLDVAVSESSSLLKSKPNVEDNTSVEVEIIDLVEFIRKLGKRVDVLKIDIEGAEVELVQKIIETEIYKEIGLIVVETHEQIKEIALNIERLRLLVKERNISNINLDWR